VPEEEISEKAAVEFLKSHSNVKKNRLGSIGRGKGEALSGIES